MMPRQCWEVIFRSSPGPDRNRQPNEEKTSAWVASPARGLQERQWKLRLFIEEVSLQFRIWTRPGESIGSGKGQSAVELRT